jgi:hypothetical protein
MMHNFLASLPVFLPEGTTIFTKEELVIFLQQIASTKYLLMFATLFAVSSFFIFKFIIKNFPKKELV